MDKYSSGYLYYLIEKPEAVVNFFGFLFTAMTFWFTTKREREQREDSAEKDRALQHRRNYFNLELEASRIFQVCVENPQVPLYLRNELPAGSESPHVVEQTYWFICQTLNAFEIIISYRKEQMIPDDLFATWVSWFYEFGTCERFPEFWIGQGLCAHYKKDLQGVMDLALRLRSARAPGFKEDPMRLLEEMQTFHREASRLLSDPAFEGYFSETMARARPLFATPVTQSPAAAA